MDFTIFLDVPLKWKSKSKKSDTSTTNEESDILPNVRPELKITTQPDGILALQTMGQIPVDPVMVFEVNTSK